MQEIQEGWLINDDLASLQEWHKRHPDIALDRTLRKWDRLDAAGLDDDWNLLHVAVQWRAVRIAEWLLHNGSNPNFPSSGGRYALQFVIRGREKLLELLIRYGACARITGFPASPHTLIYHYLLAGYPSSMKATLFWAGARLTPEERKMIIYSSHTCEDREDLMFAERLVAARVRSCRAACVVILACMPGPKDCTRDWVRRLVWSTRDRRVWFRHVQMPRPYRREGDDP